MQKIFPEAEVNKPSVIFFPVGLILSIESVSPLHNCKIHWTKYVNNLITMVIDDISKYHIDKKITAAQNNYIGLRNFWKCDPGLLLPEITVQWYLIYVLLSYKLHLTVINFHCATLTSKLQLQCEACDLTYTP